MADDVIVLRVISAILSGVSAALFAWVAVFLSKRQVSSAARGAQRGFVLWWAGIAALGAFGVLFNDSFGFNIAEQGIVAYLGVLYVLFALLLAAVGGLAYYLLYLYTGRQDMKWYITGFYVLVMVGLIWLVHGFGGACLVPADQTAGCIAPDGWDGESTALGSYEPRSDAFGLVFLLALVLPPLAGAVMYFLLFFKTQDVTARYRVAVISGGIILWFGFSLFGSVFAAVQGNNDPNSLGAEIRGLIGQLLGVFAASLVLWAYHPPAWVRRRWGVESLAAQSRSGG